MAYKNASPYWQVGKGKSEALPDVRNISKKARVKIIEQIIKRNQRQIAHDLLDWTNAVNAAKRVLAPNRRLLIDIFERVDDDGHITGIVESIKNKIKAKEFNILNTSGEIDEDATKKFHKLWFFKFLDWMVEAPFFGYSLVQLGDIVDDAFPGIDLVPREYIVPELGIVRRDLNNRSNQDSDVFHYETDPSLSPWFIFIGSKSTKKLGLYNKAAPHAIAKRVLFASAWEYAEIFGMPIRKGHTDVEDPLKKQNMALMLENMGSAAWGVFDTDDNIDLIESDKADATKVYIEPIKLSNQEISKAFAGGTGMFDEKAFIGSAEVQERLFNEFIASFMRNGTFVINDDLIPRMIGHGMLPKGSMFKFLREEVLTVQQKIDAIDKLSKFYKISPETVTEEIGIKVEGIVEDETNGGSAGGEISAKMKELTRIYKPFNV